MRSKKHVVTGALCLILAACQVGQEQGNNFELSGESTLTPEQEKEVVARIGDVEITLAEFEKRLNQQSTFARNRQRSSPQKKLEYLDTMVRFELIAREALRRGYDQDPQVKLAQKQAMVSRFTAEEISKLVEMKDVSTEEIQAYYDRNAKEFGRPKQVSAAHILLKDQATAQRLLEDIQSEVAKDPPRARKIFGRFATEHSEDTATKSRQGGLGFFGEPGVSSVKRPQGAAPVPNAVASATFELKSVGDIVTTLVKSPAGWHIVQKTGHRRALKRSLQEVQAKIRMKLFRAKKRQAMEDFVTSLRTKTKVVIDETLLKSAKMKMRTGPIPNLNPPGVPPGDRP